MVFYFSFFFRRFISSSNFTWRRKAIECQAVVTSCTIDCIFPVESSKVAHVIHWWQSKQQTKKQKLNSNAFLNSHFCTKKQYIVDVIVGFVELKWKRNNNKEEIVFRVSFNRILEFIIWRVP